ncbi:hypothetical protein PsyrH_12310 [Pseudomonas syringae pv. syringae HS191]|uniref:hypothetical protein n=1 Tax=Pseudomonas syringae TaxID=317 RepID=UPI0006244CD0|nr:hypothetical protein [Pseudomonas syringae]AKF51244.1 hypothetical protein PsyrH_12310 [Pseudomonas syringae pv. syringae HS191]
MNESNSSGALAEWHKRLNDRRQRTNPAVTYQFLARMAEDMQAGGLAGWSIHVIATRYLSDAFTACDGFAVREDCTHCDGRGFTEDPQCANKLPQSLNSQRSAPKK